MLHHRTLAGTHKSKKNANVRITERTYISVYMEKYDKTKQTQDRKDKSKHTYTHTRGHRERKWKEPTQNEVLITERKN